jgi:hypothetical protein
MTAELADIVKEFPGAKNQTRCFLHVLNLVVKSIIRQFDLPKNQADELLDEAQDELHNLGRNLEDEELISQRDGMMDDEDDSVEGWVDEREEMTAAERKELDESVRPLRLMLTKVTTLQLSLKSITDLCYCSYEKRPLLSKTQRQLSFLSGSRSSRIWSWVIA